MTVPQNTKPGIHEMILVAHDEATRLEISAIVAAQRKVDPRTIAEMKRRAEVFTATSALLLKVDDNKEAVKDVFAGKKPTQRRAG